MSELTTKNERLLETVETMLELLPMQYRMMCLPFLPNFRQLLTNIPAEEIDSLIEKVRCKLDYIERGGVE